MERKPNLAVISDIDGTISDRRHRLQFLDGKKDWNSFFNALVKDPPILDTIKKLERYHNDAVQIIFVTGRPEDYRKETINWLNRNLPFKKYKLYMRPLKNFEKDLIIKKDMLNKIREDYQVVKVFDDQEDLIQMWKEEGLDCENCSLD